MPKQAIRELFTDIDPNGPLAGQGRVLTEVSHPAAAFTLIGCGGVFSDDEVARLKLEDCVYLIDWSAESAAAENEIRNRATYGAKALSTRISLYHNQSEEATPSLAVKYGTAIASLLEKGGYKTVKAVEAASDEELLALHGIASAKLEQIRAA